MTLHAARHLTALMSRIQVSSGMWASSTARMWTVRDCPGFRRSHVRIPVYLRKVCKTADARIVPVSAGPRSQPVMVWFLSFYSTRNWKLSTSAIVCAVTVLCGYEIKKWAEIAQSLWWFATGWTVQRSNPGGVEVSRTSPDRPWGPPILLYSEYWVSFPGVKRSGRVDYYPPWSSAEIKERVELYFYTTAGYRVKFTCT
jgi:hypothetical protein